MKFNRDPLSCMFAVPLLAFILVISCQLAPTTTYGQAVDENGVLPSTQSGVGQHDDFAVTVGFAGVIRLGKWVPLTIKSQRGEQIETVAVTTRDGQDQPVVYRGLPERLNQDTLQTMIRLGREQNELRVTIHYHDSAESTSIVCPVDTTILPTDHAVLSLEQIPTIATTINDRPTGDDEPPTTAIWIDTLVGLPHAQLAYDAIDVLFLSVHDVSMLDALSADALQAIDDWVDNGGRLVISASPSGAAECFAPTSPLARFLPGQWAGATQFANSSRLESFAGSRNQLIKIGGTPIDIVSIQQPTGVVWVRDESRQPLIVQQPVGFGDIVFVAFDLQDDRVSQWESYPWLVRLLQDLKKNSDRENNTQAVAALGLAVDQVGFSDLIGQLYAPMEQFTQVGFVPFTAIAILISLFIICIGPLDYFLLKKVLKKMELTWITFPLFSILFCGLAIGISRWSRPTAMQINQLEIVDIDAVGRSCRSTIWTNVYSPSGQSIDVQLPRKSNLDIVIDSQMISWHGLPGDGLGGMGTSTIESVSSPTYQQTVDSSQQVSNLNEFSIPVASSRPLFSQWYGKSEATFRSSLTFRKRLEKISGTVTNPLDVEIVNARLYHGTWAYILDEPISPGQAFDIETEAQDRPLSSILNRKLNTSEDDNFRVSASRWELTEMDTSRIAEILMFYDAAGGKGYTGLSHGYQGFIDMSDALTIGRAVLVGQIKQPTTRLAIASGGSPLKELEYDKVTTFVRIVLPVKTVSGRRRR